MSNCWVGLGQGCLLQFYRTDFRCYNRHFRGQLSPTPYSWLISNSNHSYLLLGVHTFSKMSLWGSDSKQTPNRSFKGTRMNFCTWVIRWCPSTRIEGKPALTSIVRNEVAGEACADCLSPNPPSVLQCPPLCFPSDFSEQLSHPSTPLHLCAHVCVRVCACVSSSMCAWVHIRGVGWLSSPVVLPLIFEAGSHLFRWASSWVSRKDAPSPIHPQRGR